MKENPMSRESTIDQLNSFLRGEISAVETYRQALEKVTDARAVPTLNTCHSSHASRVQSLSAFITRLGGTPSTDSGPWGSFAKLVEGGAAAFGEAAAIAALEEGEDHGLRDYKADLPDLDPEARRFVEQDLLAAQTQTHGALSALKKSM
jgi:uncharacterized protein (TIGR02284 family)